jgi:hypothetical protein
VTVVSSLIFAAVSATILLHLPLPPLVEAFTRHDGAAYRAHAVLGTLLNWVGAPPAAAASEWLKAAYHVRSSAEIEAAASGLAAAQHRSPRERLEPSLCPYVPGGAQLLALKQAGLSCIDDSMIWGQVPDDVPITYSARPPTTGLYYDRVYPTYGVAPEPVPPVVWLHNLAHGEIILLYRCPDGCSDLETRARELQASLPPGRNARGRGARLLASAYDEMEVPIAVIAWNQLLAMEHFDRDRIVAFYAEHIDQGPECWNFYCY